MSTSQGSCLEKRAGLYHFKRRLTPPAPHHPLPPPHHPSPPSGGGRLARSHSDAFFFFFLPHLSNLGKPRVRKHKVFSKLVSGAFEAPPNQVSNPGDKVQSRYQPIGSRGFAYLKKNPWLLFLFLVLFCFLTRGHSASSALRVHQRLASSLVFTALLSVFFPFLLLLFFFNCRRLQSSEHPKNTQRN